MKFLGTSITLAFIITLFINERHFDERQLRVINVVETYLVKESNSAAEIDSIGFNVAYHKDFEVYEEPIIHLISDSLSVINGKLTFKSRESKDTLFRFFVTKKGTDKVLTYDSLQSKSYVIITRDSLFRKLGIDSVNNLTLNFSLGTPKKIVRDKKTNQIISEHFVDNKPLDESYPDKISRYYDIKLKDVSFSFSPLLDKEKKSKLVLTRFIYLPRRIVRNGKSSMAPYMEDSSLMRETKTKREGLYLDLVKRFQRDFEKIY